MSHVPNAEHIVWRYVEASWRYELRDTTNFANSKKLGFNFFERSWQEVHSDGEIDKLLNNFLKLLQ